MKCQVSLKITDMQWWDLNTIRYQSPLFVYMKNERDCWDLNSNFQEAQAFKNRILHQKQKEFEMLNKGSIHNIKYCVYDTIAK